MAPRRKSSEKCITVPLTSAGLTITISGPQLDATDPSQSVSVVVIKEGFKVGSTE